MSQSMDHTAPIFKACRDGDIVAVEELINKGVNVNIVSNFETSPLQYSIAWDHFDICRKLIEEGNANVNGDGTNVPLITAARNNKHHMVVYLLNHGADINAQNDTGWTALRQATNYQYMGMVYKLLDEGADYEIEDNEGLKPLEALIPEYRKNIDDYIKYVLGHGKNIKGAKN
uniref:Ankyrin repeat protein n=1 Tax=Marseillevirus LCMAC101 TaxID=2506602 RepID=A0A481YS95_9VIRU|nr:MAG: ankyrin repeat protein [Marseillevirus LCMAC101]